MIEPPLAFLLLLACAAQAQTFPADRPGRRPGRPADAGAGGGADRQLEALERASSRQLVVATIADLEGYPIEDYGYRLGRHQESAKRGQ